MLSYLLRKKMERIWIKDPIAYPLHIAGWKLETPETWAWLYGIIKLSKTKGKLAHPQTKGQLVSKWFKRRSIFK